MRPLRCPRAIVLSLSVLAPACASGDSGALPFGEVRDSAGVQILTNDRTPAWAPEESWYVESVLTVSTPSNPDGIVGQVRAGALGPDGQIFALDRTDGRVRVYDAEGAWLRTLGTIGEGPGELSGQSTSVVILSEAAGDEASAAGRAADEPYQVWIPDSDQRRVVRFSSEGDPLPDLRLEVEWAGSNWWQRGADGSAYQRMISWSERDDGVWQGVDRLARVVPPWDVGGADGGDGSTEVVMDSVATFVYDRPDLEKSAVADGLTSITNAPAWTVAVDGALAWLTLDRPQLRLDRPGAPSLLVRSESWVPRPPSDSDGALLVQMAEEAFQKRGLIREGVQHPDFLPALTDVLAGPAGTLWVQRAGALREAYPLIVFNDALPPGWGGQTWEVLDAGGRYLGSVELPPRFRVMDVRDDRILGAQYDVNYEDRLVVLEIQRPGSTQ